MRGERDDSPEKLTLRAIAVLVIAFALLVLLGRIFPPEEYAMPNIEKKAKKTDLVLYILENENGQAIGLPIFDREDARAIERAAPHLKVGVYDLVRRPDRKGGGS